jgi:hypothetical protein
MVVNMAAVELVRCVSEHRQVAVIVGGPICWLYVGCN